MRLAGPVRGVTSSGAWPALGTAPQIKATVCIWFTANRTQGAERALFVLAH